MATRGSGSGSTSGALPGGPLPPSTHGASGSDPNNIKLGHKILESVLANIQRMVALEHIKELSTAPGVDILTLSPFPSDAARDQFIDLMEEEMDYVAKIRATHDHWLDSILPGLAKPSTSTGGGGGKGASAGGDTKLIHDADPEFDARFTLIEHTKKPRARKEREFSPSETTAIIKTIGRQIQPLFLLVHHLKKLKQWERPWVTGFAFLFCLNMAWQDLVIYLPALLLLAHSLLVLSLRTTPTLFQSWIEQMEQDEAHEAYLKAAHERQIAALTDAQSGLAAREDAAANAVKVSESIGIIGRLKEYKQQYENTKLGLAGIQGQLSRFSQSLRRVEGLYKWWSQDTTLRFFAISCMLTAILIFVPFRYLWAVIVIDQFTEKYQPAGSAFQRLLEQVPLTDHAPNSGPGGTGGHQHQH